MGLNERCWNNKLERIIPLLHCRQCNSSNSSRQRLHSMLSVGLRQPKPRALVHQLSLTQGYSGEPVAFDERETSWRSFKFQFVAHCGAIDSRLKDLLVLGESRDVAAMRNMHMELDTRAVSAQLYFIFMLIVVCQEGAQKPLEHAGKTEGGVAWRRLLDEYEPRTAGRDPRAALDVPEVKSAKA